MTSNPLHQTPIMCIKCVSLCSFAKRNFQILGIKTLLGFWNMFQEAIFVTLSICYLLFRQRILENLTISFCYFLVMLPFPVTKKRLQNKFQNSSTTSSPKIVWNLLFISEYFAQFCIRPKEPAHQGSFVVLPNEGPIKTKAKSRMDWPHMWRIDTVELIKLQWVVSLLVG